MSDAGTSLVCVPHAADGEEPVATTTWQRGDRAPEQTGQRVEPGQPLVQAIDPGVGLRVMEAADREGTVRLHTEGDGVELHAAPVDVGPR